MQQGRKEEEDETRKELMVVVATMARCCSPSFGHAIDILESAPFLKLAVEECSYLLGGTGSFSLLRLDTHRRILLSALFFFLFLSLFLFLQSSFFLSLSLSLSLSSQLFLSLSLSALLISFSFSLRPHSSFFLSLSQHFLSLSLSSLLISFSLFIFSLRSISPYSGSYFMIVKMGVVGRLRRREPAKESQLLQ
jgi:hypothetical protein